MGFGIFVFFILIPIHLIFILASLFSWNALYIKLLGMFWLVIFLFFGLINLLSIFTTKKTIKESDIIGTYVIDRSKYPGPQADWQYNHFRFEITKEDQLIFYETEGQQILKIDTLNIKFLRYYENNRITYKSDSTHHHILESPPALYRTVWSHYYVFNSSKFGNVFFKKGKYRKYYF